MKKIFASLMLAAFVLVSGAAYAQTGGGSTDAKKEDTKKESKAHKGGKKAHKGGKKSKKADDSKPAS